jgi:hypothetical protein
MRLRQYGLLVLLVIIALSIVSIAQGPPVTLVNNTYLRGQQLNGIARNLIGMNGSGLVSIDSEAIGSTLAGTLAVTGASTFTGAASFNGGATIPTLTFTTLTGTITAANLPANLKTGYIPLDLWTARIISGNAIQNTTEAGVPDGNTTPLLQRVNGATDKQVRLSYASTVVTELQFPAITLPPDCDLTATINVKYLAAMAGASDTPVITTAWFSGIGDTNQGTNTAAVTGTTIAAYTSAIAASVANTAIKPVSISFTPGAHGTDALNIYSAWIEYTRKS